MSFSRVCLLWIVCALAAAATTIASRMPEETEPHEGTWLSWPHQYTYGVLYRNDIEKTWIAMTKALVTSENVHIIAYSYWDQKRIQKLLISAGVSLQKVSFLIHRTDDTWVRDMGPMFVEDNGKIKIIDWGFNGWGLDTTFAKDNTVPAGVAKKLNLERVNLNAVVLEGGAIEVDGRGSLMATSSSVLKNKRNPNMTQAQMESYMKQYMGITNFIWLEGKPGGKEEITDTHIDGFARFGNTNTIVTMKRSDLEYWSLSTNDIDILYGAKDVNGVPYKFAHLPLTANDVKTTYGKNLGFKGSYVNFYTANKVVLMPSYNDPNDNIAQSILQKLYPDREVIKIDVRNLYREGGMIHCVTQQQIK